MARNNGEIWGNHQEIMGNPPRKIRDDEVHYSAGYGESFLQATWHKSGGFHLRRYESGTIQT